MTWLSSASSTPTGDYRAETPEPARANDTLTRVDNLMQSACSCRDIEISAYGFLNRFMLRAANGRGLSANFSGSSVIISRTFESLDVPTGFIPAYPSSNTILTLLYTNIPGFTSHSAGDVWTFGVSGFDIYLKYNGATVATAKEYRIMEPGIAAVFGNAANIATVAYVPATLIGSNRALSMIDLRDTGIKSSSTTGSMGAGSNVLTVASSSGFAVGDTVIVEIGGESSLGRRGTEGVGGAWPPLSYTDATAMNADTGRTRGVFAWVRASGDVYQWGGSAWAVVNSNYYYWRRALPRSLVAQITAIAGSSVTLNQTAVVSTSGARIFADARPAFAPMLISDGDRVQNYLKLRVPAGTYALSDVISPGASYQTTTSNFSVLWNGAQVFGAGKNQTTLFAPKGIVEPRIGFSYCSSTVVRDIKFMGNHAVGSSGEIDGYIMQDMARNSSAGEWPITVYNNLSRNTYVTRCSFENVFRSVIHQDTSDGWVSDCDLTMHQAVNDYTQWQFSHVTCTGGGAYNLSVTCPKLIKSFEMFSSYASDLGGTVYRNIGGQNVLMSTNSSKNWLVDGFHSTITADSAKGISISAGYLGEPVLYPSANAYHNGPTGTIKDPRIIVQGYPDTTNSSTFGQLIDVSPDCYQVVVQGSYAGATTPFSSTLGGYLENVPYVPGSSFGTADAIRDTGFNTTISGIRAVGSTVGTSAMINNSNGPTWSGGTGTGTIQDCIADTFKIRAGSVTSNNRTTAGVSVP